MNHKIHNWKELHNIIYTTNNENNNTMECQEITIYTLSEGPCEKKKKITRIYVERTKRIEYLAMKKAPRKSAIFLAYYYAS